MSERRAIWSLAAVLAFLGAGLRLWHIASTPFWLDEAYSAFAAGHDFAYLWHVVPRYETHPPFYYALLHVWEFAFGDGLIALRAPGLLAALATPPCLAWAAWAAGRMLGWEAQARRRLAFVAFAFACLAISPVEMAREVRPYPLMILVYALAARALIGIAIRRNEGGPLAGRDFAAYLLLVELMLWLHNLGPLWAIALGLAFLVAVSARRPTIADLAWIAAGHLLAGLLYLPALLILADQAPTWIASTWVRFAIDDVMWLRLGVLYAVPGWQSLAAGALAVLGLAALRKARQGARLAAMLLLLALVPTILSIALTLAVAPVFITRTLTPVAVPSLLLLAIGAVAWRRPIGWVGLGAALMLGGNMLAVDLQARAAGPPQDWYGTVAWLRQRFRPGDQIFAYPNEGALPMARALRDKGLDWPIRSIPSDMPAFDGGGWHPTGSRGVVSLPRARLQAIAREPATRAVPTIWLLRLGAETYDPGDMFLDELRHGRHVVRRWVDGPIDIYGLARASASPRKPGQDRR